MMKKLYAHSSTILQLLFWKKVTKKSQFLRGYRRFPSKGRSWSGQKTRRPGRGLGLPGSGWGSELHHTHSSSLILPQVSPATELIACLEADDEAQMRKHLWKSVGIYNVSVGPNMFSYLGPCLSSLQAHTLGNSISCRLSPCSALRCKLPGHSQDFRREFWDRSLIY